MNLIEKLEAIGFEQVSHGYSLFHKEKMLFLTRYRTVGWQIRKDGIALFTSKSLTDVYNWLLRNGGNL